MMARDESSNPEYLKLKKEIESFEQRFVLLSKPNPYRMTIIKHRVTDDDIYNDIQFPREIVTQSDGEKYVYLIKLKGYLIQNEISRAKDGVLQIKIPEIVDCIDFYTWMVYQICIDDYMTQYAQIDTAQKYLNCTVREIDIIGNSKTLVCSFGDLYAVGLESVVYNQKDNRVNIVSTNQTLLYSGKIKFVQFDGQNIRQLKAQNWQHHRIGMGDVDDFNGLKLKRLDNFGMLYNILQTRPYIDIKSIDFQHVSDLYYGFYHCEDSVLDLKDFGFNHIRSLEGAFQGCEKLKRILNFDSSQLEEHLNDQRYASTQHDRLDNIPKVRVDRAFEYCKNLDGNDICKILDGKTIDSLEQSLSDCINLHRFPVIDISHCHNFQSSFKGSGLDGEVVIDGLKIAKNCKNPIYITPQMQYQNTDKIQSLDSSGNINRYFNVYLQNKRNNYAIYKLNDDNPDIFEDPTFVCDDKALKEADKLQEIFKQLPNRLRLVGNNFNSTFQDCNRITQLEIKNIEICLTVDDFQFYTAEVQCTNMFAECKNLRSVHIQNIKIQCSQVESDSQRCQLSLAQMFSGCQRLEEVVIENADLSDVTDDIVIRGMFSNCENLRKLVIKNVIISNNTFSSQNNGQASDAFMNCRNLISGEVQLENIYFIQYGYLDMRGLHRIIEAKYRLTSEMYDEDYIEHIKNHKLNTLRDIGSKVFNGVVQKDLTKYTANEMQNLRKLFKFIRYFDTQAFTD